MTWGTDLIPVFVDPERAIVDYLRDNGASLGIGGSSTTVGVGVPTGFAAGSKPHVEVAWDGTPSMIPKVLARATIRIVVHVAPALGQEHAFATVAKGIAANALALLSDHPGGAGIATVIPLTGILPAHDPETGVELASFTCQVSVRAQ